MSVESRTIIGRPNTIRNLLSNLTLNNVVSITKTNSSVDAATTAHASAIDCNITNGNKVTVVNSSNNNNNNNVSNNNNSNIGNFNNVTIKNCSNYNDGENRIESKMDDESKHFFNKVSLAAALHDHISCTKASGSIIGLHHHHHSQHHHQNNHNQSHHHQNQVNRKEKARLPSVETQTQTSSSPPSIISTEFISSESSSSLMSNCSSPMSLTSLPFSIIPVVTNDVSSTSTIAAPSASSPSTVTMTTTTSVTGKTENKQEIFDDKEQIKRLKTIILTQLDLIQYQQEQLLKKERQLQGLKQDREALCMRLDKMEKRVTYLTSKLIKMNDELNVNTNSNGSNSNSNSNGSNSSNMFINCNYDVNSTTLSKTQLVSDDSNLSIGDDKTINLNKTLIETTKTTSNAIETTPTSSVATKTTFSNVSVKQNEFTNLDNLNLNLSNNIEITRLNGNSIERNEPQNKILLIDTNNSNKNNKYCNTVNTEQQQVNSIENDKSIKIKTEPNNSMEIKLLTLNEDSYSNSNTSIENSNDCQIKLKTIPSIEISCNTVETTVNDFNSNTSNQKEISIKNLKNNSNLTIINVNGSKRSFSETKAITSTTTVSTSRETVKKRSRTLRTFCDESKRISSTTVNQDSNTKKPKLISKLRKISNSSNENECDLLIKEKLFWTNEPIFENDLNYDVNINHDGSDSLINENELITQTNHETNNLSSIEVPTWKFNPISSCFSLEGTENLDDELFLKRHLKFETDEKRRKRWDIQRLREQKNIERLRAGRYYCKNNSNEKTDEDKTQQNANMLSFYPDLKDLEYIEVCDKIPVIAFGRPIPRLPERAFSLPWQKNAVQLRTKSNQRSAS